MSGHRANRAGRTTDVQVRTYDGLPRRLERQTNARVLDPTDLEVRHALLDAVYRAAVVAAALLTVSLLAAASRADDSTTLVLVVGAGGEPEYEQSFPAWADRWRQAAEPAGVIVHQIGIDPESETPDRQQLEQRIAAEASASSAPLWLVLIGHGTFDREIAKFNLRGPDVSAKELAGWLGSVQRPLVVINCSSSSAPFINALTGTDRVIITATKSGAEQNFARFGEYLSSAIADAAADLDHDEQVSLLEAFLTASAGAKQFYQQEARLATEQALLDDNGDGLGTPATFFRGIRAVKAARDDAKPDGQLAHRFILVPATNQPRVSPEQTRRRDQLETAIDELRRTKSSVSEDQYYDQLEPLLIEMARLYQAAE